MSKPPPLLLALLLVVHLLIVPAPVRGQSEETGDAQPEDWEALELLIEQTAERDGPFSAKLFEPLMRLARLQLNAGDQAAAIDTLQRAQNISHRNEGVYTPSQLEAIQLLADMAIDDEDYTTANRQKKFAFFVAEHHLTDENPEVLAAYTELADWYMHTGQARRARRLLEEAVEVAATLEVDTLPLAILINKARRLEGVCCKPRVLLEAMPSADSDPDTLREAHLAIADTYLLGGREDEALPHLQAGYPTGTAEPEMIAVRRNIDLLKQADVTHYRVQQDHLVMPRRLKKLTEQEQLEDLSRDPQWFIVDAEDRQLGFSIADIHETSERERRTYKLAGHPIVFDEDQLNNLLPFKWEKKKGELRIEYAFTVSETGDLTDIEVIESNAPIKLNRLLSKALRKLYYRPALEDGIPVARRMTLIQTF